MITKLAYAGTILLVVPLSPVLLGIFILGMFAEAFDRIKALVITLKGGL